MTCTSAADAALTIKRAVTPIMDNLRTSDLRFIRLLLPRFRADIVPKDQTGRGRAVCEPMSGLDPFRLPRGPDRFPLCFDERTSYGAMARRNLASSCAIREPKIGREDAYDRS